MQSPQYSNALVPPSAGQPPNDEEDDGPPTCLDKLDPWDFLLFALGFIVISASMGFLGLYVQELGYTRKVLILYLSIHIYSSLPSS
jgi:hypothetical protein